MNFLTLFIRRPVATTLLTAGIALAGAMGYVNLPVSPLPQVDYPTISVTASQPGASPETMATSVATPLERHLGAIADVTEMTSSSSLGSTRITLQFGLDRDIDGAARDVQAAINAARADLPTSLHSNPTYRKVNPADAPIMILALTSHTLSPGELYDSAATILQQKLSQVKGIGEVDLGGSSLPAVRVELQPNALFKYGIGLEDIRAALSAANANSPKGAIEQGDQRFQIYTNDQARKAAQYKPLVVAYRNGSAVRLSDIADVEDSVENIRNQGIANGAPAVLILLYREPAANIIATVDRIKALLPELQASMPHDVNIAVVSDRSNTIRASLDDVERSLMIAIGLVILVVFLFLRDWRATFIPGVVVPVSLIGTFGVMYLLGYSLDNLSLMALTVATGFVVDDAIVVLENISRHVEAGMSPLQAARKGVPEVGFTVLSMSLSLIAVFIPILLMGGIVGRLFREFAVTISIAILISLAISLTTTPMMGAYLLKRRQKKGDLASGASGDTDIPSSGDAAAGEEATARKDAEETTHFEEPTFGPVFRRLSSAYAASLSWALRHGRLVMLILACALGCNFYLFSVIPKGFFPSEDTGRLVGRISADQGVSFQLMREKLSGFMSIIQADPAVDTVVGFTGGSQTNSGFVFVQLKLLSERQASANDIIARLRQKLGRIPGANLFLTAPQDIHVGGRQSNADYQYTLQADDLTLLRSWAPKITQALQQRHELIDVNSDQENAGLEIDLTIDRDTAARLGLKTNQIDNTLYDAFGQRQVSTIYNALNQYHVIMEVAPQYWQSPDSLKDIYVSTSGGVISGSQATNALAGNVVAKPATGSTVTEVAATQDLVRNQATNQIANSTHGGTSTGAAVSTGASTMIPLSAVGRFDPGHTPTSVNHQGHFVATTISFSLPAGVSLGDATRVVNDTMAQLHVPPGIHGSFAGTASAFGQSIANEPLLVVAALIAVYLVLGVLYASYVHPITILSTLPSAGIGALLALMLFGLDFSVIALIGIILLIGIVKKNAIMMIDVALEMERQQHLDPSVAIYRACLLRLRPILMTTMVALLGALPLALSTGDGAELRRPL
ncbi:MAG TPA: efflux RND transporter permease subunit, partial [Dongiaceae bacterium]|nr:efflux RND transporter permease subunit [Dongiaceae bacterium]